MLVVERTIMPMSVDEDRRSGPSAYDYETGHRGPDMHQFRWGMSRPDRQPAPSVGACTGRGREIRASMEPREILGVRRTANQDVKLTGVRAATSFIR